MPLSSTFGKVFVAPDGETYGVLRAPNGVIPIELKNEKLHPFAEDESGNHFFSLGGSIYFWDHETNQRILLADTEKQFVEACTAPKPVELSPRQVKSAWIDPAFAKELGLEAKNETSKKKP